MDTTNSAKDTGNSLDTMDMIKDIEIGLQQLYTQRKALEKVSLNWKNAEEAKLKTMVASESKKINATMEVEETDEELDKAVDKIWCTDMKKLDKAVDVVSIDNLLWETFKNCTLYENSIEIYKHIGIGKFLDTVNQWDLDIKNHNRLQKFDCLECNFKTTKLNDWKYHIISISHMAICYDIANLYSYICFKKRCKILMYGSNESLSNHMKDKHKEKFVAHDISILMEEVMKRYTIGNQRLLFFCSHCVQMSDTPIHTEGTIFRIGIKSSVEYFCSTCKIVFNSTPDMIDYHSLSVEHVTLKLFDMAGIASKINVNEIIPFEQWNQNKDNYRSKSVKNDALQLPMIVLNKFKVINGLECKCKLCNSFVTFNDNGIINHLSQCDFKYDLKGKNKTYVKCFMCSACDIVLNNFNSHKEHFTSCLHFTNCHNTDNFYSYICDICNMYMYSHKFDIINHWKLNHDKTVIKKLPMLFTFMSKIFNIFSRDLNILGITHYYSGDEPIDSTTITPYQCATCKVEFINVDDYNMHAITSEHIILKYLTPKKVVEYSDTLKSRCRKRPTKISPFQESLLLEICNNSKNGDDKNTQNVQINESETNEKKTNCTALLNYDEPQKVINDVKVAIGNYNECLEFIDKIDLDIEPKQGKQEYMKHFIKKIMSAKIPREFETSDISYYCNICDEIKTSKDLWDKHYNIKHLNDSNIPAMYCSPCSLYVFGTNIKDHCSTIEHCDYFKLINALNPVENVTKSANSGVCEVPTNNFGGHQLELNDTCDFNKTSESGSSKANTLTKIEHVLDEQEQLDKNDDLVMTNNFVDLSLDQNDKVENLISKEIASVSNDSHDTSTSIHQPNKDKNIKEIEDCEDMLVFSNDSVPFNPAENTKKQEEIINEKPNLEPAFTKVILAVNQLLENIKTLHKNQSTDEDNTYGEYVKERLKCIKNPIVKQNIKLEIDKLFYVNMKKESTKYK